MTVEPEQEILWRVPRSGLDRIAVLALLTDGSKPGEKQWNDLDYQVLKKVRNRLNTVMNAESRTCLNDSILKDLKDGVLYIKLRDPRWRVFFFIEKEVYYITELLKDPSNREVGEAKERAVGYRARLDAFVR